MCPRGRQGQGQGQGQNQKPKEEQQLVKRMPRDKPKVKPEGSWQDTKKPRV